MGWFNVDFIWWDPKSSEMDISVKWTLLLEKMMHIWYAPTNGGFQCLILAKWANFAGTRFPWIQDQHSLPVYLESKQSLIILDSSAKTLARGLPLEPCWYPKLLQASNQKQEVHEAHQIGIIILATQGLNGLLLDKWDSKMLENKYWKILCKKQGIVGNCVCQRYQFI